MLHDAERHDSLDARAQIFAPVSVGVQALDDLRDELRRRRTVDGNDGDRFLADAGIFVEEIVGPLGQVFPFDLVRGVEKRPHWGRFLVRGRRSFVFRVGQCNEENKQPHGIRLAFA